MPANIQHLGKPGEADHLPRLPIRTPPRIERSTRGMGSMTNTTRDRKKRLPDAELDNPNCGVCYSQTDDTGDSYICHDCGITYSHLTLAPNLADPDQPACGKPCTNEWHTSNPTHPGYRWKCYPCALPINHTTNDCHGGCHTILTNQTKPAPSTTKALAAGS